jgi:hypothetical protein
MLYQGVASDPAWASYFNMIACLMQPRQVHSEHRWWKNKEPCSPDGPNRLFHPSLQGMAISAPIDDRGIILVHPNAFGAHPV